MAHPNEYESVHGPQRSGRERVQSPYEGLDENVEGLKKSHGSTRVLINRLKNDCASPKKNSRTVFGEKKSP